MSIVPPKTVLVVDDDEKIAESVAALLRLEEFEARTATGGLQGYSTYFRDPTDWVVTDVEMPGFNGIEMVHCIRAVNPNVRVVYMTGAVDLHRAELDREAREFSATVLRKPFSRDSLVGPLMSPPNSQAPLWWVKPRRKLSAKVA